MRKPGGLDEMVNKESVDEKMMLARREDKNVIILEIWGDVDMHSIKSLDRELEKLLSTEKHILLNLSQTYYMDSIGLSLLINFQKRQREKGKFFGLCSPRSYMKRILKLARLYGFLTIFDNESDAIHAFSKSSAMSSCSSVTTKPSYRSNQIVLFVLGILEALLAFRFVLKLCGASSAAGFASFVYSITSIFVIPFKQNSMFPITQVEGSIFEWTTLLAIMVYWLVALAIIRILVISKTVHASESAVRLNSPAR